MCLQSMDSTSSSDEHNYFVRFFCFVIFFNLCDIIFFRHVVALICDNCIFFFSFVSVMNDYWWMREVGLLNFVTYVCSGPCNNVLFLCYKASYTNILKSTKHADKITQHSDIFYTT